jgi:metal-sulfur cluster biosynthetic enzyme
MGISRHAIIEALSSVIEPELKKDIVTLNLVNIVDVKGKQPSHALARADARGL